MAALAEILVGRGAVVSGSDGPEKFYTDALLARLGVPYRESFSAANVQEDVQLVVHSPAYSREENVELREALRRGPAGALLPGGPGPTVRGRRFLRGGGDPRQDHHHRAGRHPGGGPGAAGDGAGGLRGRRLRRPLDPGARRALPRGRDLRVPASLPELPSAPPGHHQRGSRPPGLLPRPGGRARRLRAATCGFCRRGARLSTPRTTLARAPWRSAADRSAPTCACSRTGRRPRGHSACARCDSGQGRTRFRLAGLEGEFSLPLPGQHMAWNAAAALALAGELLAAEGRALGPAELEARARRWPGFAARAAAAK